MKCVHTSNSRLINHPCKRSVLTRSKKHFLEAHQQRHRCQTSPPIVDRHSLRCAGVSDRQAAPTKAATESRYYAEYETSQYPPLADPGLPSRTAIIDRFEQKYYTKLDAGVLQSFGRLFKNDLRIHCCPRGTAIRAGRTWLLRKWPA